MSKMLKKIRKTKFQGALPEAAAGSTMSEKEKDNTSIGLLEASTPGTPSTPNPMSGIGISYFPSESGAQTPVSLPSHASHASFLTQRDAFSIMASHLYKIARAKNWFSEDENVGSGVALRLAKGQYSMCPSADPRLESFYQSLTVLNVEVAMKCTSPVARAITGRLAPSTTQIPLTPSEHVQVVESMEDLKGARKAQNACFVRQEQALIIWCDHVDRLESSAQILEDKMIAFVWKSAMAAKSGHQKDTSFSSWSMEQSASQSGSAFAQIQGLSESGSAAEISTNEKQQDSEMALDKSQIRETCLQGPLLHGLAVAVNILLLSIMARTLVQESALDGKWLRLAIFASAPFISIVMLFFCDNIIGSLAMILAPIRQMSSNSRYYSGLPPTRMTGKLPHITIQMPVYKESLEGVIKPTVASLEKAISRYELQGGTASIIVSEDGMQLISEEDREIRQEYYDSHNIGWVARPGHNQHGYVRKGRFKKASNLNFTCQLSLAVERSMNSLRPTSGEAAINWTESEETALYQFCLEKCLPEQHDKAEAAGIIRIGDLILLIDSDTRVPEDCLLDAASEMSQCPDVGVLQHCSGVMLVTNNYFERGIGFFTRLVNFSISYVVSNGDVAPFMGHNAFLRWSAIQEASFVDPEDGIKKVWSESHVSEDFDMALRLIALGYITRWATYSNNQFEEGVSLTCDDELNRWQKYAFGCSELVFNPLLSWFTKGPITPLFRRFLTSRAPLHYKFSACSYIFSYYAIGTALPLSIILFLLQGWFYPILDPVFLPPFQIWVAVTVVFMAAGNFATIIARYRSKSIGLLSALLEHLTWLPFTFVFFGGLSYHVLTALLAHPLGINMTWGATVKDLEDSNFFIEVPAIFKKFWRALLLCFVIIAGIAVLASGILPLQWRIEDFFTYWPTLLLATLHVAYPIVLNPALLRFSF